MLICQKSIKKTIGTLDDEKRSLFTLLIKDHSKSQNCGSFLAFIDNNGLHRGSQKIDVIDEEHSTAKKIFEDVNEEISEMTDLLRCYHLKVPRKEGRGFEHKVSNVADRAFMSSRLYSTLITFLTEHKEDDAFGILACKDDANFKGGNLIYGNYGGIIYTVFWNDQSFLQDKCLDEIQEHANRI